MEADARAREREALEAAHAACERHMNEPACSAVQRAIDAYGRAVREAENERAGPLLAAAKDFVAKVDRGEARSVRSYAAFKAAIEALERRDD